MLKILAAEAAGTFWLVLGGCGYAFMAGLPAASTGLSPAGLLGVSLAFGLAAISAGYSLGRLSGGHFNPAVSLGLWLGGRFDGAKVLPYMGAQVLGAVCAGGMLAAVADAVPGFLVNPFEPAQLATNGYGALSPGGYSARIAFLTEMLMTGVLLIVFMSITDRRRGLGAFAPLVVGLTLVLIHLVSLPITFTSVNPARSTGVAVFAHYAAVEQLWLFWLAPLLGGVSGAAVYRFLDGSEPEWA